MANLPQIWTKRLAISGNQRSVGLPFASDDPAEGTERYADSPILVAGTLKNFRVDLDTAAAVGDWTFTIYVNGVASGLTVTIPQGSTTATITGVNVSLNVLDLIRIREESTASATAKPWTYTVEFVPDVAGERAYGGGVLNSLGDAGDPSLLYKQNPLFPRTTTWGISTLDEYRTENCPIGQDGTITKFLIYYQIEFLSGEYEFCLWKSTNADIGDNSTFVKQDGSGGTVDTRTTLDSSSPVLNDSDNETRSYCLGDFSLPVSQGDAVFITAERISGTTFPVNSVGLRGLVTLKFVADDDATWFISGSDDALGSFNTNYFSPVGDRTSADVSSSLRKINFGPFGIDGADFKGLIIWTQVAPGTGNDRTFNLLVDGVASDILVTLSGTNKKASDNGSALVGTGQSAVVEHVPVSIPDGNTRFWFAFFGESSAPPPDSNTIIVIKRTIPATATDFDFSIDGGLSPATFTLADGESQTFTDVPDGTYDVTETPNPDYDTTYEVSNGDPHDAIEVSDGDSVTVTVTNRSNLQAELSGMYEMVPNKTDDTVWLSAGVTEDRKIP